MASHGDEAREGGKPVSCSEGAQAARMQTRAKLQGCWGEGSRPTSDKVAMMRRAMIGSCYGCKAPWAWTQGPTAYSVRARRPW